MIGLIFGETNFPIQILKKIKKKNLKYLIVDLGVNMLQRILIISIFLSTIVGCAPKDPSIYDIKSPCAANNDYTSKQVPCIKRSPIGNLFV